MNDPKQGLMGQAGAAPSNVVERSPAPVENVGFVSYKPTPADQAKLDANPPMPPPIPPEPKPPSKIMMEVAEWEAFKAQLAAEKVRAATAIAALDALTGRHNEVLAAIAGPINLLRRFHGDTPLDLGQIERILRGL